MSNLLQNASSYRGQMVGRWHQASQQSQQNISVEILKQSNVLMQYTYLKKKLIVKYKEITSSLRTVFIPYHTSTVASKLENKTNFKQKTWSKFVAINFIILRLVHKNMNKNTAKNTYGLLATTNAHSGNAVLKNTSNKCINSYENRFVISLSTNITDM